VAGLMTNFELSENADFMNNYIAALFLPHTDLSLFPVPLSGNEGLTFSPDNRGQSNVEER